MLLVSHLLFGREHPHVAAEGAYLLGEPPGIPDHVQTGEKRSDASREDLPTFEGAVRVEPQQAVVRFLVQQAVADHDEELHLLGAAVHLQKEVVHGFRNELKPTCAGALITEDELRPQANLNVSAGLGEMEKQKCGKRNCILDFNPVRETSENDFLHGFLLFGTTTLGSHDLTFLLGSTE